MYYEIKIFTEDGVTHYVKTDFEGLDNVREGFDNDCAPNFIEVYCYDDECTFAIRSEKVDAYSYKEALE
jgi:hypothetical protein